MTAAPPPSAAAGPEPDARFVLCAAGWHADPGSGSGIRTRLLFEAMRAAGPTVVAILSPDGRMPEGAARTFEGAAALHAFPARLRGVLRRGGADRRLRDRLLALAAAAPAATVYVFRYLRVARAAGIGPDPGRRRLAVVDLDDREEDVAGIAIAGLLGRAAALGRPIVALVRRRQARELARFSRVLVVGDEDARDLALPTVRVMRNAAPVPAGAAAVPPPSAGRDVLFVGHPTYEPNALALAWTLAEVWPRLADRFPESALRIVGRGDMTALRRLAAGVPRVRLFQDAPDLAPHYAAARVAICPVTLGGGSKIKAIEACAWGRPLVATPHSVRGLGGAIPPLVDVAADAPAFAEAVARHLGDPALADRRGAALRAAHDRDFDRDRIRDAAAAELRALVTEPMRRPAPVAG